MRGALCPPDVDDGDLCAVFVNGSGGGVGIRGSGSGRGEGVASDDYSGASLSSRATITNMTAAIAFPSPPASLRLKSRRRTAHRLVQFGGPPPKRDDDDVSMSGGDDVDYRLSWIEFDLLLPVVALTTGGAENEERALLP